VSGVVWIWVSDRIPVAFITDQETMILFQTLKGIFYVAITALLLYFLIYRQIRKQNNLIKLLRKKNRLMNFALSQHAGLNVLLIDRDMMIIQAFGKECLWADKKMSDIQGVSLLDWAIDNVDKQHLHSFFKRTLKIGKGKQELNVNGQWYLLKGTSLAGKAGKEDLFVLVVENISQSKQSKMLHQQLDDKNRVLEQKVTEEAFRLRSQQIKFREVVDDVKDGVIIRHLTPQGHAGMIENINRSALNLLGLTSTNISPEGLWDNVVAEDDEDFDRFLTQVFTPNSQVSFSAVVKSKTDHYRIIVKSRFVNAGVRPYVMTNISERLSVLETESNEHEQSLLLYRLLNSFSDGVMLINPDLQCVFCNHKMHEILKWVDNKEEISSISDLHHEMGDMDYSPQVLEAMEGQMVQSADFMLPQWEDRWFSSLFLPVKDNAGKVELVVRLTQDVSVRRSYETTLYNQQTLVDESTRLKTLFLSNLSHEVRTPMNGILGFVELLEQDEMSETQKYYLDLIRKSSDNLLSILNALVEVAHIENGHVTVDKQWVETLSVVHEAESYLREKLKFTSKNFIEVHVKEIKDKLPEQFYSDPRKILDILKLLIDNAVKFTQKGWIEIGVSAKENGHISFWVHDTGIGINKMSKYQIFQPFMTYNDSENVLYGGLGLGLSIAKGLSHLLGAHIELETEVGKGSRFILSVPLQLGEDLVDDKIIQEANRSSKVLMVQYGFNPLDNTRTQLKQHNVELLHADDGTTAIDKLFEVRDIDLIITDVRLSDMDCFELIRALKRINNAVPVIAQSAYFVAEEKQRCMNEGFADYLVKPVDQSLMIKLLRR
jgi:signal transduction histidine kinase/CheY-like chemotaxis protein